jgi:hypothetical protein
MVPLHLEHSMPSNIQVNYKETQKLFMVNMFDCELLE